MTTAVLERACEYCGEPFTPARSDARFCCNSHRALASKRNRNPQPATVTVAGRRSAAGGQVDLAKTWQPTIGPRQPYITTDPCPYCGSMLLAGPRGTWRICAACRCPVVLAAVSAPYAAAAGTGQRHVVSQRERDLEAIALERRRGVMLTQLAAVASDDRLHPESAPVVDWLIAEVRGARTQARLDDLADLAASPDAGIRRRSWWQGRPSTVAPSLTLAGDDEDLDDDPDNLPVIARPAIEAARPATAPRSPATWADAIAACGWQLSPAASGCQIIDASGRLCGASSTRRITGGWTCPRHNEELSAVLYATHRP